MMSESVYVTANYRRTLLAGVRGRRPRAPRPTRDPRGSGRRNPDPEPIPHRRGAAGAQDRRTQRAGRNGRPDAAQRQRRRRRVHGDPGFGPRRRNAEFHRRRLQSHRRLSHRAHPHRAVLAQFRRKGQARGARAADGQRSALRLAGGYSRSGGDDRQAARRPRSRPRLLPAAARRSGGGAIHLGFGGRAEGRRADQRQHPLQHLPDLRPLRFHRGRRRLQPVADLPRLRPHRRPGARPDDRA